MFLKFIFSLPVFSFIIISHNVICMVTFISETLLMYLILDCHGSFVTTYLEPVSSWENHLTSLIQRTVISTSGPNFSMYHKNAVCAMYYCNKKF